MSFTGKFGNNLKEGAAAGVLLYPSSKLVWSLDSAARNVLPVGLPSYARTPLVTLALTAAVSALPSNFWTDKAAEMVLAAGMVQTIQQIGQTTPGTPGTVDMAVNKVFQPIANLGMKGYATRLRGYVTNDGANMGAIRSPLRGYVSQMRLPQGTMTPGPIHPNDMGRASTSTLRAPMRGYQAEHLAA